MAELNFQASWNASVTVVELRGPGGWELEGLAISGSRRPICLRSLERSWEVLRIQQLPFFNFTNGALTGSDCEAPHAVQSLPEWSLDLVNRFHNHRNLHRSDRSPRESESKWGCG